MQGCMTMQQAGNGCTTCPTHLSVGEDTPPDAMILMQWAPLRSSSRAARRTWGSQHEQAASKDRPAPIGQPELELENAQARQHMKADKQHGNMMRRHQSHLGITVAHSTYATEGSATRAALLPTPTKVTVAAGLTQCMP